MRASEINVRFLVGTGVLVAAAAGLLAVVHHRQMSRHARDQLARAERAEADHQPAEMVRSLARSLSFDPGNQEVRGRYALALADQARTPAERWKALQVLGHLPQDDTARLKAAELALELGEPDDAMRHLKPALEADPDNPDRLALLARCQEAIGHPANAAESLRKALTARPTDVDLTARLAELYRRLDRTKQADAVIERLVRDNPRSPSVRLAAARFHSSAGRLDRADRELDEARRLAPTDVAVLQASAQLAEQQGEVKQAVEWRRQLVQRQPDRPDAHVQLAQAEREAGQPGQAIAALRDGLKRIPDDADLLFELGFLLLDQGDAGQAKAVRERLPAASRGKALGLAGRAAASAGNWYQAARDYSAALDQLDLTGGQRGRVLLGLAECYDRLGGREEQRYALRQAVQLDPTAEARLQLARALVGAGQGATAVPLLRSLAGRPTAPAEVHTLLARALLDESRRRGAGEEVEQTLARAERDPAQRAAAAVVRAELLAQRGELRGARDLLDRAITDHPEEPALVLEAIDLALRQDDEAAARTLAERGDARFGAKVDWFLGRADRLARLDPLDATDGLRALERRANDLPPTDRTRVERHLAALHARLGNAADADRLCRQILARHPDDRTAQMLQIEGLIGRGEDGPAAERIAALRRSEGPTGTLWRSAQVQLDLAQASRGDRGRLAEARKLIEEMRQLRPVWAYPLLLQGRLADLEGKPDEALACYREVIQRGDPDPRAVRRAVQLLIGRGQYVEASTLLDGALAGVGDVDLVRLAARLALETGKPDRARDLAIEAVPLASRSAADLRWRADILDRAGRTREAEDTLHAAIRLDAEAIEPRLALIALLVRANRLADAQAEAKRLDEAVDAPRRTMAAARAAELLGRFDEAEKGYLELLRTAPRDVDALRRLAEMYLRLDQSRKAEGMLAALLAPQTLLPDEQRPEVRRQLALALTAPDLPTDRTADALKLLELNRKQASDGEADRRIELLVRGRDAAARARCLEQLEAMPGGAATTTQERLRLARLYDADGRWPAARTQLLALVGADGRNPAYLAALIDGLLRNGKRVEAAGWVERLEQLDPTAASLPAFKQRLKAPRS